MRKVKIILALIGLGGFYSCTKKSENAGSAASSKAAPEMMSGESINGKGWLQHIRAKSSGTVSKAMPVFLSFQHDIIEPTKVGTTIDGLFEIKPSCDCILRFSKGNELELRPKDEFHSNTVYTITLRNSGQLKGIPKDLGDFTFLFATFPADFDLEFGELVIKKGSEYVLAGTLTTSDQQKAANVEAVLQADISHKTLSISWTHSSDGKEHRFVVSSIKMAEKEASVNLVWDGSPIGVSRKGAREISIPGVGDFAVLGAATKEPERDAINVYFSNIIDSNQDFTGLVTINGKDADTSISGNVMTIFPKEKGIESAKLALYPGLRSVDGSSLAKPFVGAYTLQQKLPGVRFIGKGVIIPDYKSTLTVPFEAANVDSVQISAFQIFDTNIGQFFQNNAIDESGSLQRVGRHLWKKTVKFNKTKAHQWNQYALDVSELLKKGQGSIFQVTISINRANAVLDCTPEERAIAPLPDRPIQSLDDYDYEGEFSNWESADEQRRNAWEDRENPCKDSFYNYSSTAKAERNFLTSGIGLMAKQGQDNSLRIITTNIKTAEPLADVAITAFDYQSREISRGKTDSQGFLTVDLAAVPFYLTANKDESVGYLKLNKGSTLSTSHFSVGGTRNDNGVKGYIYGERGVWRPGDDIHLTLLIEDKEQAIPDDHPATLTLRDPKQRIVQELTNTNPLNGFYYFKLKTSPNDPTGTWKVEVSVGQKKFQKDIRIETIRPNRLKIELDIGDKILMAKESSRPLLLKSRWLHGADAPLLKTRIQATLKPTKTDFGMEESICFDDLARSKFDATEVIFDGNLGTDSSVSFKPEFKGPYEAPGVLATRLKVEVYEPGGEFSTAEFQTLFSPYDDYVGIKVPAGDKRGMLLTDVDHTLEVFTVNADGKPISLDGVDVQVFKIEWRWWWDKGQESFAEYASGNTHELVKQSKVSTKSGKGEFKFQVRYPAWGRYMVRACLPTGHCSSSAFYLDWPGWAGRSQEENSPSAASLTLETDKPSYLVGEKAIIKVPENIKGRSLLSIETSRHIISQRWLELKGGKDNAISIDMTGELVPTGYISMTLLQPHSEKSNDRPLRLYGIVPIGVEDPKGRLSPEISVAESIRPETDVNLTVSEKNKRAMTYTLAMVDEGLLGITNFSTPDPFRAFNVKEGYGVKNWDLFDQIIGSYDGQLETLLAIGGSDAGKNAAGKKDTNRFASVAAYFGPFSLKAGETKMQKIAIPNYLGAVRFMVVAADGAAYGNTEKEVKVAKPIVIMPALPRKFSPGETIQIPVSVFVTLAGKHAATVAISASPQLKIIGKASQSLSFSSPGEQMAFFTGVVGEESGLANIAVSGELAAERVEQKFAVPISIDNPEVTDIEVKTLSKGESFEKSLVVKGVPGTNEVNVEVSSLPALNLQHRIKYLLDYPYGCVEQTTSALFPQLYLGVLLDLDENSKKLATSRLNEGIDRLRNYQNSDGGFSYWPGEMKIHDWATSYVGHFLIEAKGLGYAVPESVYSMWLYYQKDSAKRYVSASREGELAQAYRLYTLALAGSPELGAMNRIMNSSTRGVVDSYLLAAAYRLAGQEDAANSVIAKLDKSSVAGALSYTSEGATLGSPERDNAIILAASTELGAENIRKDLLERAATTLADESFISTHAISYSFLALAKYVKTIEHLQKMQFSLTWNGKTEELTSSKPIWNQRLIDFDSVGKQMKISSHSDFPLYISVAQRGVPKLGAEIAKSADLKLDIDYYSINHEPIDISKVAKGDNFIIQAVVTNHSGNDLTNIALNIPFASAWETTEAPLAAFIKQDDSTFRDHRDSRQTVYFDLVKSASKRYYIPVHVSYAGKFYVPAQSVTTMYDAKHMSVVRGQWITIRE